MSRLSHCNCPTFFSRSSYGRLFLSVFTWTYATQQLPSRGANYKENPDWYINGYEIGSTLCDSSRLWQRLLWPFEEDFPSARTWYIQLTAGWGLFRCCWVGKSRALRKTSVSLIKSTVWPAERNKKNCGGSTYNCVRYISWCHPCRWFIRGPLSELALRKACFQSFSSWHIRLISPAWSLVRLKKPQTDGTHRLCFPSVSPWNRLERPSESLTMAASSAINSQFLQRLAAAASEKHGMREWKFGHCCPPELTTPEWR